MATFHHGLKAGAGGTRVLLLNSLIALAILFASTDARGDRGWRVGGDLLVPGDSKARVLGIAGPPDLRETLEFPGGGAAGERWYYVFDGYDRLTRILTFRGGRLVRIRTEYD